MREVFASQRTMTTTISQAEQASGQALFVITSFVLQNTTIKENKMRFLNFPVRKTKRVKFAYSQNFMFIRCRQNYVSVQSF